MSEEELVAGPVQAAVLAQLEAAVALSDLFERRRAGDQTDPTLEEWVDFSIDTFKALQEVACVLAATLDGLTTGVMWINDRLTRLEDS